MCELYTGMTKLVAESQDDAKLRSMTYVAIGKISRRVPQLVGKDVGLLQTFFDSLCKVLMLNLFFLDCYCFFAIFYVINYYNG